MKRIAAPAGISPQRVAKVKVGARHAHGCTTCHARYSDACADTANDGLCQTCRGTPRPLWEAAYDPIACCLTSAVPVRGETRARYSLAGTSTWFICLYCARTHPFDPRARSTT